VDYAMSDREGLDSRLVIGDMNSVMGTKIDYGPRTRVVMDYVYSVVIPRHVEHSLRISCSVPLPLRDNTRHAIDMVPNDFIDFLNDIVRRRVTCYIAQKQNSLSLRQQRRRKARFRKTLSPSANR
jgi:hypothetical protein